MAEPKSSFPVTRNGAAAPMVYFDQAPAFGAINRVCELELTARFMVAEAVGKVKTEFTTTAHLRASPAAMLSLRAAIDSALEMAGVKPESHSTLLRTPPDYREGPRKPS